MAATLDINGPRTHLDGEHRAVLALVGRLKRNPVLGERLGKVPLYDVTRFLGAQVPHGQPPHFLGRAAVNRQHAVVRLDDAHLLVEQHDHVFRMLHHDRKPLADGAGRALRRQLPLDESALPLLPQSAPEQRSDGGEQSQADENLHRFGAHRRVGFRLIHLGYHGPWAVTHGTGGADHRHTSIIHAFHRPLPAVSQRHGRQHGRFRERKTAIEGGAVRVAEFIEQHHLVAFAAQENKLAGCAWRRPLLKLPEQCRAGIDDDQDTPCKITAAAGSYRREQVQFDPAVPAPMQIQHDHIVRFRDLFPHVRSHVLIPSHAGGLGHHRIQLTVQHDDLIVGVGPPHIGQIAGPTGALGIFHRGILGDLRDENGQPGELGEHLRVIQPLPPPCRDLRCLEFRDGNQLVIRLMAGRGLFISQIKKSSEPDEEDERRQRQHHQRRGTLALRGAGTDRPGDGPPPCPRQCAVFVREQDACMENHKRQRRQQRHRHAFLVVAERRASRMSQRHHGANQQAGRCRQARNPPGRPIPPQPFALGRNRDGRQQKEHRRERRHAAACHHAKTRLATGTLEIPRQGKPPRPARQLHRAYQCCQRGAGHRGKLGGPRSRPKQPGSQRQRQHGKQHRRGGRHRLTAGLECREVPSAKRPRLKGEKPHATGKDGRNTGQSTSRRGNLHGSGVKQGGRLRWSPSVGQRIG